MFPSGCEVCWNPHTRTFLALATTSQAVQPTGRGAQRHAKGLDAFSKFAANFIFHCLFCDQKAFFGERKISASDFLSFIMTDLDCLTFLIISHLFDFMNEWMNPLNRTIFISPIRNTIDRMSAQWVTPWQTRIGCKLTWTLWRNNSSSNEICIKQQHFASRMHAS
jgi:hypothetical protein